MDAKLNEGGFMAQLGFGLNTNTTAYESGYDQYKKTNDFEFIPLSILLALVIIIAIFFLKKSRPPSEKKKLSKLGNLDLRDTNKQSFFDNKVINEHIKLINQNLMAMILLRSVFQKVSNYRALADTQDMLDGTNSALSSFLTRDFTKKEIHIELDTNMFLRRAYDEVKLNTSLGKFDKVVNPEYDGKGNWEETIAEYRAQIKWIN